MIVVVGAGAAGLAAAIFAAERASVTLVERTSDGGRKILISGGGRCNVLPVALEPDRFVSDSPAHLVRAMLRSWPLQAQRAFFEDDVGVRLVFEQQTGKIFPASNRARDVRDRLVALARRRGVHFQFETLLTDLRQEDGHWRLSTNRGDITGTAVVLATGGLSVPATGSDGVGLDLAAALGHARHATYPALTPLIAGNAEGESLSGISIKASIRARWMGKSMESSGGFLFTHRGYSGPAVLDVSHIAVRSRMNGDDPSRAAILRVAWTGLATDEWEEALMTSSGRLIAALGNHLPQRLARYLLEQASIPLDCDIAELRRSERKLLIELLTAFQLPWAGDEGYKKAEVTGGGIALQEVDRRTLESKRHRRLFLCGEMLDAFGPIGGHNFAWAWATGRAAGIGASEGER